MDEKYIVLKEIHEDYLQAILNDYYKKGYEPINVSSYIKHLYGRLKYNVVLERKN